MVKSQSDALVIFGVTGDLAHKMIFPALYAMVKRGALKVPVIGVAFPKWRLERLRKRVTDSITRSGGIAPPLGRAPSSRREGKSRRAQGAWKRRRGPEGESGASSQTLNLQQQAGCRERE